MKLCLEARKNLTKESANAFLLFILSFTCYEIFKQPLKSRFIENIHINNSLTTKQQCNLIKH